MSTDLQTAFRFHLQNMPRYRHGFGEGLADAPRTVFALAMARRDVAAGINRYPAPVKGNAMRAGYDADKPGSVYVENPERYGLRLVGRVVADCRRDVWDKRGNSGWYDNPYGESFKGGSGLIYGLVYQLPAHKGQSRFVAAYQNGANDSGALIDFGTIYASGTGGTWGSAQDDDDARDAARAADSMAQRAAETEREYRTAWAAGARYSDESGDLQSIRQEIIGILAERRALKGTTGYPALCKAITARVRDLLGDMSERRKIMRNLADGEHSPLIFWPGDKRLAEAFNDGAGEQVLPA